MENAAMMNNLPEKHNDHNKLWLQTRLLQALNSMAAVLATTNPEEYMGKLREALEILGTTAGADRACIWRNILHDGRSLYRKACEWSVDPGFAHNEAVFQGLVESKFGRATQIINARSADLPLADRAELEADGTKSFLIVPLWLDDLLWGFLSFSHVREDRLFIEEEKQVLQAAGSLMALSVIQHDTTKSLLDARTELTASEKLLRAVNEVAVLLIRDEDDDDRGKVQCEDDFIARSLQVLAEAIDADRGFLWRNNIVDGVLCSTELCEWARGVRSWTPNDQTPVNIPLDGFLPEWRDTLMVGKNLNMFVKDMTPEFRNSPAGKGVCVTMNIPLVVHGDFWGLIGFDNMHEDKLWSETEMDILQSAGMLIAASIMRREMLEHLVDAREEAWASTRAKSEFLSRMSHEIRTPLNAVIGMTALAHKTDDQERIKYCLDKIDGASRQLLSIINDVLDMSKIESGKFEIYVQPFDFEKMLQHSINVVQVKLEEKHQELELEMGRFFSKNMVSDELRMSQVLINLLTNAIKFTPDYGTITMRIKERPLSDRRSVLHVEVADTGIGISKAQQKLLFTSFVQADGSISRQFGGTGLGLAICKKITNLMNGDIWVESEPGHGSTFIFEVEVDWGDALEKIAYSLRDNLHVLVVDDSPDVLEYFVNVLEGFGITYDTAANGAKAIELAREAVRKNERYDLVFIDWGMPGMDGCEAGEVIQEISGPDTRVIIISVADHADIKESMKRAGLAHFLAKPVLPSVLYNTILQLSDHALAITRQTSSVEKNWRGKRILLAEDIEINREIMSSLLESTGVAIDFAFNGAEAVDRFRNAKQPYDLILMDVQMPIMDGLTATRTIRADVLAADAKTIPIIAMTANAFKEDVQACLEAGMNSHIAKPIEVNQVMDTLGQYLD